MFAERVPAEEAIASDEVLYERPTTADGSHMWELAESVGALDLNSPYSYLLWARDFSDTSVVARHGRRIGGFVTGFLRPTDPGVLFVWQVAVAAQLRGRGIARAMLDAICDRRRSLGFDRVEATVTPGNTASERMFESLAGAHGASLDRRPLFDAGLFPGAGHEPEILFTIGPIDND